MNNPFFSILIPSFNCKQYIKETLDSCFNQKFKDFEVILCDNCSYDNINLLLENFKNDNFKYFLGKKSVSSIQVRNFLINKANGKYVVWVEPSDIISEDFLQEAYDILINQHYDILEMKPMWKVGTEIVDAAFQEPQEFHDVNCLGIYMNRDDMNQDSLWGKVIFSDVMKKCIIDDYDVFSAEEVFYSVPLYMNATSYKKVKSNSYYLYNSEFDHFHGLSSLSLDNVKYMCRIRNEQLVRNLKLLKNYNGRYDYQCLNKIYLFHIFNDILNLKKTEEIKEAFDEFYKYFNLRLSSNLFDNNGGKNESN